MLVHPSPIDRHETQFAVNLTEDLIQQKVFPAHRLDKATSGLLLFALNSVAARQLGEQFMSHQIQKHYLALCRGWLPELGLIDHPLQYKNDPKADRNRAEKPPQDAYTNYRRLVTCEVEHPMGHYPTQRYSQVKLSPITGRKHQLRRHLNHISHPIIGDVQYGDRHHNHFFNDTQGHHRLYLAATELHFTHPLSGEPMHLTAPLEPSFQTTLDAFIWHKN